MDMEIGNGNGEAVTANPGLDNANINSLIVFARDVIRLASNGTLCQRAVEDAAAQYGLIDVDEDDGISWAGWLSPLVDMFDQFEHEHIETEDPDDIDAEEGGDGAEPQA